MVMDQRTMRNAPSGSAPPPAPELELTGPSSGDCLVQSADFTVTIIDPEPATDYEITYTSTVGGDTFTSSLTLNVGNPSDTFRVTPNATAGARTITIDNDQGLDNPAGAVYTAVATADSAIGGQLTWWLKAHAGTYQSAGGAAAVADNDALGQWQDQKSTNHFVQASGPAKPLVDLAVQNGYPAIYFTTDDCLQRAVTNPTATAGGVFVVINLESQVANQTYWSAGDNGATNRYLRAAYGTTAADLPRFGQTNADTMDQLDGTTALATGTTYIIITTTNGSAYKMMVNGVDQTPLGISGGSNTGDWLNDTSSLDIETIGCLGRSNLTTFLEGRILEIGKFDVALTDPQITALNAALNAKYAVHA